MFVLLRRILSCFIILFLNGKLADGAACNGLKRLFNNNGTIESPGFTEKQGYPKSLKCTWILFVPTGFTLTLTFESFELEESKTCKDYDYVTIKEKCTETSGISGNLGGRSGGYCGKFMPPVINSTCKELHITFYSDDTQSARGFRAKYKIHQNEKPRIITCMGDKDCNNELTQKEGESFTFHCRVKAYPRPRRYWARVDGKPLPADITNDNNGTLKIKKLRYPQDTGEYMCIANNTWGEDRQAATLEVIEKCLCPAKITTNWFHDPPFVIHNENSTHPSGIFPNLIDAIIKKCCNNCSHGHGISHISYGTPKQSLNEVKNTTISDQVIHLSFPIRGKEADENYNSVEGAYYRPLFSSPGIAVLVMKEDPSKSARAILNSVLSTWPVLLLTLVMAWLAGSIMWALDTWNNPDEFPRHFHRGVLEGFWWAFVTMTTVGYGDRSPKGYVARAFAIFWILCGLTIISITTGVITTSLTAITLSTDLKLYGAKVGALANSTGYRMGVRRNSKVVEFSDIRPMLNALEDRTLDGILLDSFIAGANSALISSNVRVNKIISYDSSYGIVFRSLMESSKLKTCYNDYVSYKSGEILELVEKYILPLKEPKKSASEEITSGLFNPETLLYKRVLFFCIGMLLFCSLCGLIWDYGYQRHFKKNDEFDDLASLAGPGYKAVKANMELLDTLMQEVQDFNDVWTERLDETMKKHDAEYVRFSQQVANP